MNIVVTFDDNYVEPALKMLYSLKMHNDNLKIHVIYDNLSAESIEIFKKFVDINELGQIEFYYFETNKKDLSVIKTDYITKSCYLRLYAPYIIKNVEKILYLDPDIVCQKSIEEIYNLNLGDKIIGACHNMLRENIDFLRKIMLKDLGLPIDSYYVNSGVLLIDVSKYREYITAEELDKFLEENTNRFEYHDQDVLNYLFHDKIKIAAHEFNYQINAVDLHNIDYNQVLIHYSEKMKPWKENYNDLIRAIPYYKLLYKMGEQEKLKKLITCYTNEEQLEIYKKISEDII